jgi:cobalamin biosynthesis Mg chelatase CobN
MRKHQLHAHQVAALLGVKPNTVACWVAANVPKEIPAIKLELLTLKLENKK